MLYYSARKELPPNALSHSVGRAVLEALSPSAPPGLLLEELSHSARRGLPLEVLPHSARKVVLFVAHSKTLSAHTSRRLFHSTRSRGYPDCC